MGCVRALLFMTANRAANTRSSATEGRRTAKTWCTPSMPWPSTRAMAPLLAEVWQTGSDVEGQCTRSSRQKADITPWSQHWKCAWSMFWHSTCVLAALPAELFGPDMDNCDVRCKLQCSL